MAELLIGLGVLGTGYFLSQKQNQNGHLKTKLENASGIEKHTNNSE